MGVTELSVLGGLSISADGEPRPLGGPHAQRVLAVLAAHVDEPVSPDRLVDSLWDDRPPRTATGTIQTHISRLRSALSPAFSISLDAGGYRLKAPEGGVDAGRFEALLRRSLPLGSDESVQVLEAALALWHGPAFGPCAELDEVRSEAVRLDELRLVATDGWAEAKLSTGDPAVMVGELEALVSRHPLRESFRRSLMTALYRTGRQGEALRRCAEFRRLLADELGLDPSERIRELEVRILADDPSLRSGAERSGTVRARAALVPRLLGATTFVGRDPLVAALSDAVAVQPLLTLTGPGGVGKTRLALRVAGALLDSFVDGVTVVELAPLRDPSGVVQAVASALDIQQRQFRTLESTIEDHLTTRSCLLVLDNCEHVIESVAVLVDRLRTSCPQLRVLATSREPLGLPGECVEVLGPLSLPPDRVSTVEEVAGSAAVELLIARASTAQRGFALSDDNVAPIAAICHRLDGLPLALELAAARLRTMDAGTLADRLGRQAELLGRGQRGGVHRHRSLHHLVEWSYDLLEAHERQVFAQLAVFAGGFDLAAAEAVCTVGPDGTSTLGTLAGLVDKSMVVFVDPGQPRYRLLEPLREFGLNRLGDSGSLDTLEQRHLEWFLALAERGAVGLDGPDEAAWSAALTCDLDNFRVAHLTALRRHDADRALAMVAALRELAFRRIDYEIEGWADRSIELVGAGDHPDLPTALAVSAYGHWVRGDRETAIVLAHRSIAAQGVDEPSSSGLAERVLGNAHFYVENIDEALGWMDRVVTSARRSGSAARIAHGLYMRSVAQTSVGDNIRGAALAGEARAAATTAGSPTARAQADYALGMALESTDADDALAHLDRASRTAAAAGNRWIEAFALTEVHWLRANRGERRAALTGYGQVIDTWHRGGDWANQWLSLRRVFGLLVDLDAAEPAAVLHGALGAAGAAHALPFEPVDAQRLAERVESIRALLGHASFTEAMRRGASMSDNQIVAFVKAQIDELTASG